LRYVPHGAARSLITRRTHTIGALLPDLHGEFFSELIRGIDLEARSHGPHLPEGLPSVLLNSDVKSGTAAVLNIDNFAGTYAMVRHLVALGHARIAFVTGPKDNYDARQREAGFRAAMAKLAPGEPLRIVSGNFSESSGYLAARELLEGKTRPQAVFAANDMMAVGCLQAFKEAGLAVPGDIALAG